MSQILTTSVLALKGANALVQQLAPGGRLVRSRRLRGGLGAKMHALTLERSDGSRFQVSLRRSLPSDRPPAFQVERVAREFETLRLLERAGIAAPRPLLLDADGQYFGVPMLVQSFLPGKSSWPKRNSERWAVDLAWGLLAVHRTTPNRFDLSGLPRYLRAEIQAGNARKHEQLVSGDELMAEVLAALEADLGRIEWVVPCLVHNDYHPGNTMWLRGKLVGIIDWSDAVLGDPRADVAQCRLDLIVSHGVEIGAAFVETYQRSAPARLPDLWYFDLHRGLRALLYYERWLVGYHDAGLTHLTSEECGARLRSFLRSVLCERTENVSSAP